MITFNRKDHPDHIPQSGHFPLVVDPIIGKTCLSHVLMDGESGLNLLYAETYDAMGLSRVGIQPFGARSMESYPGFRLFPLGKLLTVDNVNNL
jgi:hypothetical protein